MRGRPLDRTTAAILASLAAVASIVASALPVGAGDCVCPADCDADCVISSDDFAGVVSAVFSGAGCPSADVNADGGVGAADVLVAHAVRADPPPGCSAVLPATPTRTDIATRTSTGTPTPSHSPTRTATSTRSRTPTRTATHTAAPTPVSRWIRLSPLPAGGRQEVGVAHLDGRIYVIGGLMPQATDRVDAYDIATDEWIRVASLPAATHHIGAAAIGGHVYAIGGLRPPGFTATDAVYRYDADADRWDAVASLPTARGAMAVAVANGRIHAIAGDAFGAVRDHAAYIPEENRWIELTPYPLAREHIAAATVGGAIYVVGGRGPLTTAAYRWNDTAGIWQQLPPMNQRRAGHAAAGLDGLLVTFGGEGNPFHPNGLFPEVEIFDPGANEWTTLDDMAVPRHGIGAVTVGNRIYVPGGADLQGFGHVDTHDALELGPSPQGSAP